MDLQQSYAKMVALRAEAFYGFVNAIAESIFTQRHLILLEVQQKAVGAILHAVREIEILRTQSIRHQMRYVYLIFGEICCDAAKKQQTQLIAIMEGVE